jgi:hypothetical protein
MAETGFENASAVQLHKNRMEKSFDCLKEDYHLDTEPMRLPYPPAARDRPAGRGNNDALAACRRGNLGFHSIGQIERSS